MHVYAFLLYLSYLSKYRYGVYIGIDIFKHRV